MIQTTAEALNAVCNRINSELNSDSHTEECSIFPLFGNNSISIEIAFPKKLFGNDNTYRLRVRMPDPDLESKEVFIALSIHKGLCKREPDIYNEMCPEYDYEDAMISNCISNILKTCESY